ncbi:MAG: heme ABC exporter ATP-binding protein CcmA [Pseudomonadota bacterium]|jgi:heme exporter protein A
MTSERKEAPLLMEVRDLACRRGGRLLFRGLEFTLAAGEALLLTGRNGVGKTSLLRLLAGLAAPAEGALSLFGVGAGDDPEAYRRPLAYLGHHNALKPAETVAANVAFWVGLRGGDKAATPAALDAMGIADLSATPVRLLSAGQRRRTALARVIAAGAKLWLLDEPATGLDSAARRRLDLAIARHRAGGGVVIAAAHGDLALPEAHACCLDDLAA